MKNPVISVVMGCYNDSLYIKESIDSILNQSFADFEFIIIDDNSSDNTVEIIKSYDDKRIRLYQNTKNQGLGYSLNKGVELAKGDYIARMDADDISKTRRLEIQLAYLQKYSDVLCVGSSAKKIGDLSFRTRLLSPIMHQDTDSEVIKVKMLFGTPILHPTVMFNARILRYYGINYNPTCRRAQDYELGSRVIWQHRINNIDKVLLCYRSSKTQASSMARPEQIKNSVSIYKSILSKIFNSDLSDEDIYAHVLFATKSCLTINEFEKVIPWISKLQKAVLSSGLLDSRKFNSFVTRRFCVICRNSLPAFDRIKYLKKIEFSGDNLFSNIIRMYI